MMQINYRQIIEKERLSSLLRADNFTILLYLTDIEDHEVRQYF